MIDGALAQRVSQRLDELGMSIRTLATESKASYEHARKIAKGETLPSRPLLELIAQTLQIPFEELEKLAQQDRLWKEYGITSPSSNETETELAPIKMVWEALTAEHRTDLVHLARRWAKQDRGKQASGKGSTGTEL
jgi:transcriptional regulator with XRE-family HTH domain